MDNCTFLILGATGDLATTRLIPALYDIILHKKINTFFIIGLALDDVTAEYVLEKVKPHIKDYNQEAWDLLVDNFYYTRLDFSKSKDYDNFAQWLNTIKQERTIPDNWLIYCAIPPQFFLSVTEQLSRINIIQKKKDNDTQWIRVVYEKPFGHDKKSARKLNKALLKYLDEFQIFRIDHYLAKDIVGTIVLLRFTNRVLEPLWNKENIEWVEIILSEDTGVQARGSYYDAYGAIKDVVQNHMLQLVALMAMEEPVYLSGEYIRDQKAKVLKKIKPVDVLFGQYEGYLQEQGVAPKSSTETFAAMTLAINNARWRGVPFYLKTGKYLNKKETVIYVQFKAVECRLAEQCVSEPNYLTIRIMPNPGFALTLNVKQPGMLVRVSPIAMDFCYECEFDKVAANSYEYLLREVIKGEPSVSVRFDEIEFAWDIVDKLKKMNGPVHTYKKDTQGPEQIHDFEKKHSMKWHS